MNVHFSYLKTKIQIIMKRYSIVTALLLVFSGSLCLAQVDQQEIKEDFKPSTLNQPEVFSHYALLSGGTYSPDDIKDKSKVKLIFLSCVSKERPDGVKNAVVELKDAGLNAVSYVSEGTAHEFLTWRRSLLELAPLLFKD
jgi:hypothetical protein